MPQAGKGYGSKMKNSVKGKAVKQGASKPVKMSLRMTGDKKKK